MSNFLMNSFNKVLLNEELNRDGAFVYHCAKINTIDSIGEVGFERYFTGKGVGNAYGPGIYTTFDLKSTFTNAMRGEYGRVILRCKVKSLRNFIIYSKDVARRIYGRTDIDFQLQKILPKEAYEELKFEKRKPGSHFWNVGGDNTTIYQLITNDPSLNIEYTSYCAHACDWYGEKNQVFDNSVDGFIFNGPHDGYVCILRNFKIAYPVEISYTVQNAAKQNKLYSLQLSDVKFEPFKTHAFFEDFAKNDIDLVRDLKKNGMLQQFDSYTCPVCGGSGKSSSTYCPACFGIGVKYKVPEYFIDNFARVMKDGKYNFLYRKNYRHGVISPVGFDRAPETFSNDGTALVTINGNDYTLKLTEPPIKFSVYDKDGKYLCNLKQLDTYLQEQDYDDEFEWG